MSELQFGFTCLRRLLEKKKGKVKYQKENKTKEDADIVNHLHEM